MSLFPILGLDLGSHTGVAYAPAAAEPIAAHTWHLATPTELRRAKAAIRESDPRMARFCASLRPLMAATRLVVWEDVQFSSSTAQTQLWASFRGALWAVLEDFPTVERMAVPVGTLKKWSTGSGAADKDQMRASLTARVSAGLCSVASLNPETILAGLDDNAVDAVWLVEYARTHYEPKTQAEPSRTGPRRRR